MPKRTNPTNQAPKWFSQAVVKALAAQEAEIIEMNKRHAGLAVSMIQRVAERIRGDDVRGITGIDPALLSPADCARLAEVATKIERLSRGAESERVQANIEAKADRD
jgi:hypothetical protein